MEEIFTQCTVCPNKNGSLFNSCSTKELENLSEHKSCNSYKKGEVIFREGKQPGGVFCMYEGKVKISKAGEDGKEQIIRLAKPGDTLGYRSLIEGSKYSASAVALDDTKVCFIPNKSFNEVVNSNMKVANDLLKMAVIALGETENKMTNLSLRSVRERLAEALLMLEKMYKNVENEVFSISISRDDLAAIVGAAKETTIRALSEFKNENIISSYGSLITILNRNKLMKICQAYV